MDTALANDIASDLLHFKVRADAIAAFSLALPVPALEQLAKLVHTPFLQAGGARRHRGSTGTIAWHAQTGFGGTGEGLCCVRTATTPCMHTNKQGAQGTADC